MTTMTMFYLIYSVAFSCGVYCAFSLAPSRRTNRRHWLQQRPIQCQLAPMPTATMECRSTALFLPTELKHKSDNFIVRYHVPAQFCLLTKTHQGGHKVGEKNSLSFPGFSRAKNLHFCRLSQQKVNVIMTFIKGHSTSTPEI